MKRMFPNLTLRAPPNGFLQAQTGPTLLNSRKGAIQEIARLVGVPEAHFQTLYVDALVRYAAFVQQLPASESHHHAGPGGLLDHTLEVVICALQLRRGVLMPTNAPTEVIARCKDVWTYAVFTCALAHDVGKVATQQTVHIFDARTGAVRVWSPWTGPMANDEWYGIEFNRGRQYVMHERIAPLLVRGIVPDAAMAWLGSDTQVIAAWSAYMSQETDGAGALGTIVSRADQLSVARNLGANAPRFAAAKTIPLHEKLLSALRAALTDGDLPLNRNGAAGWLLGNDLWLVSKRTADALRERLQREGHEGIPARNDRLFDVLQEHKIAQAHNEQAIWRITVGAPDWDKAHTLTVLRVPVTVLWPLPEGRPTPFEGTVTVLDADIATEADASTRESPAPAMSAGPSTLSQPLATQDLGTAKAIEPGDCASEPQSATASTPVTDGVSNPFLAWLAEGLASGQIPVNQPSARVHIVSEGVLLISPVIFRDYARAHGGEAGWERAQKSFLKAKVHLPTTDKSNLHHYRVEKVGGNYADAPAKIMKGILIAPHHAYGDRPAPPANTVLHHVGGIAKC